MATTEKPVEAEALPGFDPLPVLWEGTDTEPARFKSEWSARWMLRRYRPALMQANALALHCGRVFVNRERFTQALSDNAVDAYNRRYGASTK